MHNSEFLELFDRTVAEVREIFATKGVAYTEGNADQFHNFKMNATELRSGDKYDVFQIYWSKHVSSLKHWFKTREEKGEPKASIAKDILAYTFLLIGMWDEDQNNINNLLKEIENSASTAGVQPKTRKPRKPRQPKAAAPAPVVEASKPGPKRRAKAAS